MFLLGGCVKLWKQYVKDSMYVFKDYGIIYYVVWYGSFFVQIDTTVKAFLIQSVQNFLK